ncbi:DUF3291 domain-containing protein [Streptomyces sp. NPDC055099]
MPHLALYTFGVLKSPLADPAALMRDFLDRAGAIYQEISRSPGYLAHAEAADGARGAHFDLDWGAWGEFAVPAWYGKGRTADTIALAASLSLWTGLRPAFDAVYTGLHRAALNRRHDWFERSEHPNHVFWWVGDGETPTGEGETPTGEGETPTGHGETPTWQDGVSRLEHLRDHGPTPHAFTFHHAFSPQGSVTRIKGGGLRGQ